MAAAERPPRAQIMAIGLFLSSPTMAATSARNPARPRGLCMVARRAPTATPVWRHSAGERTSMMVSSPAWARAKPSSAKITPPPAAAGPGRKAKNRAKRTASHGGLAVLRLKWGVRSSP